MTREEIERYRQKLRNILKNEQDEGKRLEALKDLAKELGAGYVHTKIAPTTTTVPDGNGFLTTIHRNPISISESELVLNINNALQIETMIDMCKTAAKNYKIAVYSAIAAWIAVFVTALIAFLTNNELMQAVVKMVQ